MQRDTVVQRVRGPLAAMGAAGIITWYAFGAGQEVPLLDWFDLAIHETGHLLGAFLPRLAMFLAGSVAQVAFPLVMAAYFAARRRDFGASGFCLAWAGTSAWDVSVYARDAVTQSLPLVGGGEHDWAYILGPRGFDALHMTENVAGFIEFCGAVFAVSGLLVCLGSVISALRGPRQLARPVHSAAASDDAWVAASALPFRHDG